MQQPSQSPVSPSFLIETFDHFFCDTLHTDSNFSLFQKEWQNFKSLLNKDSLDLDQIFTYIAQVQANLLTSQEPVQPTQAVQPVVQHTKPSQSSSRQRELAPIDTSFSLEKTPVKTPGSKPKAIHPYEKSNSLFEIQEIETTTPKTLDNQPLIFPSSITDGEPSPVKRIDSSNLSPYATGRHRPMTPQYARAFSLQPTATCSSPHNKSAMVEAAPITSRFNMNFLLEKSKSTNRKLADHTDTFLENFKKSGNTMKGQERSLLRKVKVHNKKANPEEVSRSIDRQIRILAKNSQQ